MRISDRYTSTSFNADELNQAKLKLKNECPVVLSRFVARVAADSQDGARKLFGLKPKVPLAIAALAELDGDSFLDSKKTPWQKAQNFVNTSLLSNAQAAMPPAPSRASSASSFGSQVSKKSVSFSSSDSIASFFKDAAPTDIDRL